ncbi:MAG: NAD-dependent epimerase/dehydratase family protein [Porticoccaceae bacterium]|nr:NAD-dependent epimerase/dehydratase family protein [Porticoccaceae bacterium]
MINLDGARITIIGLGYVELDNFATSYQHNLENVQTCVTARQWRGISFIESGICNLENCQRAIITNKANIDGFVNMLVASRDPNVKSFTSAASSSTYGGHPGLRKVKDQIGKSLSPYAPTKYINELNAKISARSYSIDFIALRYFNAFGKRQHSDGAHAAVIPKWLNPIPKDETIQISGDDETNRELRVGSILLSQASIGKAKTYAVTSLR